MQEIILLKLGEVVLKGLNRHTFEDKLLANIRRRLKNYGDFQIYSKQSTVYVEPAGEGCDVDAAFDACQKIFGAVAVVRARPCAKDREAILACAKEYLREELLSAKSFKVESKRADKSFPMSSIQISQYVGGELHDAFPHLTVDVHHPELTVMVEVREKAAYVHGHAVPGAGGLPIGMGGHCSESPLRGASTARWPVGWWPSGGCSWRWSTSTARPTPPPRPWTRCWTWRGSWYPWCGRLVVHTVPFTEIQETIRRCCPEEYFTLIMRRFMMRCAQRVAERVGAKALHHRGVPGTGGQPDHGGHGLHRGCRGPARLPARGGHGQGGDHPHRPEDRHLRDLHPAL